MRRAAVPEITERNVARYRVDGFAPSTDTAAPSIDPSTAQQSVDSAAPSEDAHVCCAIDGSVDGAVFITISAMLMLLH